jgi:tetratricopeptide (TPR) repeat protein
MFSKYIFLMFFIGIFSLSGAQQQVKQRKPYQLYESAESKFNEGRLQEALEILDECLKLYPGYYDAYALRAGTREQLKDLDGALTDYSIYLEKIPDNPDVLMSRAVLRYNLGLYEQSREDFIKMLTLSSAETNAIMFRQNASVSDKNAMVTTTGQRHNPIVLNYLGLIESKVKNPRLAISYLDSAIRLDPREPDFFVNRGLAKESVGDSTSAFMDYETALALNPDHTLARHNFEALKAKGTKGISKEERLSHTINVDSTMVYPYLERAQQRFESGFYEGALQDYDQALRLDPENAEIWFARGLTNERLKDYKEAFSDYTKAIDIKEDYAKIWLSRGNVLLKLERYSDAIEDYNVALVYRADYPSAYYNRAMAHIKLNENAEACADFKHAENLGMKVDDKIKSKICH